MVVAVVAVAEATVEAVEVAVEEAGSQLRTLLHSVEAAGDTGRHHDMVSIHGRQGFNLLQRIVSTRSTRYHIGHSAWTWRQGS